jgi:hypothetical protein
VHTCTPSTWEAKERGLQVLGPAKLSQNKTKNKTETAGCWWLTPVILATQEAEIGLWFKARPGKKSLHKKGLMEWLKV